LRGFLVRRCGLARKQVRPETSLQIAIPERQRQGRLQQLSAHLAIISPPELVRPGWLKALLLLLIALAGLIGFLACANSKVPPWLSALLALAATGYVGVAATKPWRTEFPKELGTVGALVRWIMTRKANLAAPETISWTRDQVAARVREIVVNILACET